MWYQCHFIDLWYRHQPKFFSKWPSNGGYRSNWNGNDTDRVDIHLTIVRWSISGRNNTRRRTIYRIAFEEFIEAFSVICASSFKSGELLTIVRRSMNNIRWKRDREKTKNELDKLFVWILKILLNIVNLIHISIAMYVYVYTFEYYKTMEKMFVRSWRNK